MCDDGVVHFLVWSHCDDCPKTGMEWGNVPVVDDCFWEAFFGLASRETNGDGMEDEERSDGNGRRLKMQMEFVVVSGQGCCER